MTEEQHQILQGLVASQADMQERQEEMAACMASVKASSEKVEGFLYDPPFEGARGNAADDTMAQWLHKTRQRVEAGSFVARLALYGAGFITAVGGAMVAMKGWAGQ